MRMRSVRAPVASGLQMTSAVVFSLGLTAMESEPMVVFSSMNRTRALASALPARLCTVALRTYELPICGWRSSMTTSTQAILSSLLVSGRPSQSDMRNASSLLASGASGISQPPSARFSRENELRTVG